MIVTKRLRQYAGWLEKLDDSGHPDGLNFEDYEALSGLLHETADALDAARNANLVTYRAAAMSKLVGLTMDGGGKTAEERCAAWCEAYAHAQLAAERKP
jgi:hypothetical protein